MKIGRELFDQIVAHAREDAPDECCGMIAADDGTAVRVYRATNAEASPVRYSIDANEIYRVTSEIDRGGLDLGAIYHSHTRSAPYPSQTDINLALTPDGEHELWRHALCDRRRRGRRARGARVPDHQRRQGGGSGVRGGLMASEPLLCPSCASTHALDERFCPKCGMPLVYAGASAGDEPVSERQERARKIKPQYAEGDLVRVAGARNQAEAEFIQGMLLEEGVPSTLRRTRGFDVPTSWPPARAT